MGNLRGPRLSCFCSSRWSVFIWITANLTNETRRPSSIPLGDGIRPKRNSVCFNYASSRRGEKKKKSNEKDQKKNKAKRARHSRSISSQPQKDQRKLSFLFWLALDSFFPRYPIPHYHYTLFTNHHPLQPLYSSSFFHFFFSPSTASSGLVFVVRLGSGFVFCTVLFIFCVSEHISLLEDCFGSELKQFLQRFTGRVLETVEVVD